MKLDMLPHDFIMIPSKSDPSVEHMCIHVTVKATNM